MEVPFSFQEPEYTYDTGFAEDPFVQQEEAKRDEGWSWAWPVVLGALLMAGLAWRFVRR
jgi:hypothetical protein